MNPNDATRVISVIDKRIMKHIGVEGTTETTWGEVCAISADGKYASAYLYGETDEPSQDFRLPSSLAVAVGDKVKVAWNSRGERWVYDVALASDYKKVAIDHNAGTIKVGDGTTLPSILIADSTGVVVGVHNHDADYEPLGAITTHEAAGDPHPGYATDADLSSGLAGKSDTSHDHDADYSALGHDHASTLASSAGLLRGEVYSTSSTAISVGSTDTDVNSSFRVTYPGNAARTGSHVLIYVYFDLYYTWGNTNTDHAVSIIADRSEYLGSTRMAFTRSDYPLTGVHHHNYTGAITRFANAETSIEFKIMVRRIAPTSASNWSPYSHASDRYVSRLGYMVVGYV